jgi:hypothetical protein
MVISDYSIMDIGGYQCYYISDYYINCYWWLFRCKPLVIILLVVIDGYFINGLDGYCIINYYWIFYVIISYVIGSYYIVKYLKLFFASYYFSNPNYFY